MQLFVSSRSWIITATQGGAALQSIWMLYVYAKAPDPAGFQRYGAVMIFWGVVFLALHGPNLIDWQIARHNGDEEAKGVRIYELTAFLVNILMIGGGTLITGYGDYAVCGMHGKGFQSCSF